MNAKLYTTSQIISALLYPMLMPTYGMVLYILSIRHLTELPAAYIWVALIGTIVFTLALPLSLVLIMIYRGNITDIYIRDSKQRTMPYVYTAISYGFWAYFCYHILHLPTFFVAVAIGATIGIAIVGIINLWWKISAHLTGFGGLIGGVMSFCLATGESAITPMLILSIVAAMLCWARIYDESHTPLQVMVGYLLGLVLTFIPNIFICA